MLYMLSIGIIISISIICLWSGIVFLLSYLSNWQKLAVKYHTSDFPEQLGICSGVINRCRYSGTLRYAASDERYTLRLQNCLLRGTSHYSFPGKKMEYETGIFFLLYPVKITVDGVKIYLGKDVKSKLKTIKP